MNRFQIGFTIKRRVHEKFGTLNKKVYGQKLTAFSILGLPENSDTQTVKQTYKALAFKYHPDRNINSSENEKEIAKRKYLEIQNAYNEIINKGKPVSIQYSRTHSSRRRNNDAYHFTSAAHQQQQAAQNHTGTFAILMFGLSFVLMYFHLQYMKENAVIKKSEDITYNGRKIPVLLGTQKFDKIVQGDMYLYGHKPIPMTTVNKVEPPLVRDEQSGKIRKKTMNERYNLNRKFENSPVISQEERASISGTGIRLETFTRDQDGKLRAKNESEMNDEYAKKRFSIHQQNIILPFDYRQAQKRYQRGESSDSKSDLNQKDNSIFNQVLPNNNKDYHQSLQKSKSKKRKKSLSKMSIEELEEHVKKRNDSRVKSADKSKRSLTE